MTPAAGRLTAERLVEIERLACEENPYRVWPMLAPTGPEIRALAVEVRQLRAERDQVVERLDALANELCDRAFHPNALFQGDGAPILDLGDALEALRAVTSVSEGP